MIGGHSARTFLYRPAWHSGPSQASHNDWTFRHLAADNMAVKNEMISETVDSPSESWFEIVLFESEIASHSVAAVEAAEVGQRNGGACLTSSGALSVRGRNRERKTGREDKEKGTRTEMQVLVQSLKLFRCSHACFAFRRWKWKRYRGQVVTYESRCSVPGSDQIRKVCRPHLERADEQDQGSSAELSRRSIHLGPNFWSHIHEISILL